jgi:hypothetical protein
MRVKSRREYQAVGGKSGIPAENAGPTRPVPTAGRDAATPNGLPVASVRPIPGR